MGSIAVIEKNVGLDKTVWKLPVVLVEDYDDVTPTMLRQAYIEAIYRVNEFEFERLTQHFWLSLIEEISTSRDNSILYSKFPHDMSGFDETFTRPKEYFNCGENNKNCGKETKRIPRSSC